MNSYLCTFNHQQSVYHNFKKYIKKYFNQDVKELVKPNNKLYLGYSKTTGVAIGTATRFKVHVILNGYIHHPLPGWESKDSPLSKPNKAAEYLLKRYLTLGNSFTKDIYGHFSVIIVDENTNRILVARDPYGHNDVFFYHSKSTFLCSNKLKAIQTSLGKSIKIDRNLEDFLLIYGFYPKNKTMFENVQFVPPSSVVVWHKNKCFIHPVVYKKEKPVKKFKENQLIDKLYENMIEATKELVPKQKKVAVLLGGFDSALIAALLRKIGKEVETFSFYYKDSKFNQKHTDTVAKHLGIKHNFIKIDEEIIKQGMEEYSHIFNKPTNWPNYVIQTSHLVKTIKAKGIHYCYSGDGCDYLFYGYPITFKRAKYLSNVSLIPKPILKVILALAERPTLERIFGRPYQVTLGILRGALRPYASRHFLTFRIFDELSLKQLRYGKMAQSKLHLENLIEELAKPHIGLTPIRLAYQGKMELAPYRIKMNGSSDTTGVIIASPYLHHKVKHFALSLPDKYLRPSGSKQAIGKYILAKMAEEKDLLPSEVIYQEKMGAVDAPLEDWYNGYLKPTVLDMIKGLPFKYNPSYIETLIKPKWAEALYSKYISKDTSNIVTLTHCISLIATYAHFTKPPTQKV